jgi:hypothetical protein
MPNDRCSSRGCRFDPFLSEPLTAASKKSNCLGLAVFGLAATKNAQYQIQFKRLSFRSISFGTPDSCFQKCELSWTCCVRVSLNEEFPAMGAVREAVVSSPTRKRIRSFIRQHANLCNVTNPLSSFASVLASLINSINDSSAFYIKTIYCMSGED